MIFTAEAIATLGTTTADHEGYTTYHVLNPHEDGISLDTYVDWLIEAGYPITRIGNYTEWLTRFETALRRAPEKQKQHSLLPLLHAFAQPAESLAGAAHPTAHFHTAVQEAKQARPRTSRTSWPRSSASTRRT